MSAPRRFRVGELCLLAILFGVGSAPARADDAIEVPLHGQAKLRFASIEEGAKRLAQEDPYSAELSRFDCQVRLGSAEHVSAEDVRRHAASQVIAWSTEEIEKVTTAVKSLHARLEPLRVSLPETVLLIQTTGREEGEAAYCRYPAIILPKKLVGLNPAAFEKLLTHELFHIVSRHDPELRRRLYALVGFTPCEPIAAPPSLRDRKITNPDAPSWDNVIRLTVNDRTVTATPILFASVENFDPAAGGSLFKYLQFRLLVVESDARGRWTPRLVDNQPELLEAKDLPDYERQIGRNTRYIIHPDEILADNFAHLVMKTEELPTPDLVERLRVEFTAP